MGKNSSYEKKWDERVGRGTLTVKAFPSSGAPTSK